MEKHPLHLKDPQLHQSGEVQAAVSKHERLEDETLPNDPTARIDAYMDRLENIFLNEDEHTRTRNLDMLRERIYDALVIKRDAVPEAYFELQRQVAREQGHGDIHIAPDMRERMIDTLIEDQKHSLESWMSYLTSPDAVYPPWFKYFVWKNITKLSQFDKSLGKFKERTKTTTAPFPDIFREPLAQVCDVYEAVAGDNTKLKDPKVQEVFSRSFPKVYASKIQESLAHRIENREAIKGTWIKYEQGKKGDASRLYASLQGKSTGWCTAGQSTAETQIKSGDFYVYYTENAQGEPIQPRIAIRMDGTDRIGEVRGILEHQALEPEMQDVLDEKLATFGHEADAYRKKSSDMKRLTALTKKHAQHTPLTKDDLRFLYEIDTRIEGFGYERDPRIDELQNSRDREADIVTMANCALEHLTTTFTELDEQTEVFCDDTGKKITLTDFREEKYKTKLPQLIELAQKFKQVGSPAALDLSFEGGIVSITYDPETIREKDTAFANFKDADNGSQSHILIEWKKGDWHPPTERQLDIIVLSYNADRNTRVSSDKIVADMDKAELRPLTLEEMIIAGIQEPKFTKTDSVYFVGLTKYTRVGGPVVPSLRMMSGGTRWLDRNTWDADWNERNRFLCVRKSR